MWVYACDVVVLGFVCLLLFLGAFYGSYAACLLCWGLCLIYVAGYVDASLCLLGF